MHRTTKALLLLMILALVTACTGSGSKGPIKPPQPVDKAGTDNALTITKRHIYRGGPANLDLEQGINLIDLAPGQEEVVVGRGEVMVTWELAQARNDHKERVRATGFMYDQLNTGGSEGSSTFVQAHFPAGAPERFEAWLDGVEGSKIVLVRKLEPTITIGLKLPGKELTTIDGLETSVPNGAFTLEFTFDQPMVEQSLTAVLSASGISGAKASWASDRRAVVEFTANPGRLDFKTQFFQAATGLLAVPRALVVRTASDAAYLERVNLSTGARELIMDMPSEIVRASLSPDGKYLSIEALEPRANQQWGSYGTVADLTGKKLVKPDLPGATLDWRENKLVHMGFDQGVVVWDPRTGKRTNLGGPRFILPRVLSPDGKWVASMERQTQQSGEPYEKTYPYTLVLTELATGKGTPVDTNFINSWYFGKDGIDLSQWLTWSHDGKMLLALNPTNQTGGPGLVQLVAFDRSTGQKRVLREMTDMTVWGRRLYPSPDGKYLIAAASQGSAVLIPLGDGQVTTLPAATLSTFWDATGARLLYAAGDWDTVSVRSIDSGARQDLGKGMPAGWDGDWVYIIRWPGSDHRYIYEGI